MKLYRSIKSGAILAYATEENISALLTAIHIFKGVRMTDLHKLNQTASNRDRKTTWPLARKRRLV